MTREEASRLYDELYAAGQAILSELNPCQISKCGGSCVRGESGEGPSWCCEGCKHLGPKGCTVKALTCKLWLCVSATRRSPEADERLRALYQRARAAGLITSMWTHMRMSKEEVLERWPIKAA